LAKFYVNYAPCIGNQTAKFQSNLPKQTTATATFVRSSQNTSVSGLVSLWITSYTTTWNWSVLGWSHNDRCCLLWQI